jgi:hypothetical protein
MGSDDDRTVCHQRGSEAVVDDVVGGLGVNCGDHIIEDDDRCAGVYSSSERD